MQSSNLLSISSLVYPLSFYDSVDFERMTQDELVQYFAEDPRRLENEILLVLAREDERDSILRIFQEGIKKIDNEEQTEISKSLINGFFSLPLEHKIQMMSEAPFFFADFIGRLGLEDRKKILKKVTSEISEWKNIFLAVFESLDFGRAESEAKRQGGKHFFSALLNAFSNRRKRQWLKYCAQSMSYRKWGDVLFFLEDADRSFLIKASMRNLDFDLSEDGYVNCIEAVATHLDHAHQKVKKILNLFLHKFYQSKTFGKIIHQLGDLSDKAQVALLNAMTPSKKIQIFCAYSSDLSRLARWYDQLLLLEKGLLERKRITITIFQIIQKDEVIDFLQRLCLQNFTGGAYLLAYLPPDLFDEFLFNTPLMLRTHLLSHSVADSHSAFLLQMVKKNKERSALIYEMMNLDMNNTFIPIDPTSFFTLKNCYEFLQTLDINMEVDCSPFILRIPPLLIGLLAGDVQKRTTLFQLARYMSPEQLAFLICDLDRDQFYAFTLNEGASLSHDRFLAILQALRGSQLSDYLGFKSEELDQLYKKFNEGYLELNRQFERVAESSSLSRETLEEMQKQVVDLWMMCRRPSSAQYYFLSKWMQDSDNFDFFSKKERSELNRAFRHLQQISCDLTSKRPLFEGPHALINSKMNSLEAKVLDVNEKTDLTAVLYEGFWTLVREGNLPYLGISPHSELGITHSSDLISLGIHSNQDLERLGISGALEKKVGQLIRSLETLLPLEGVSLKISSSPSSVMKRENRTVWSLWEECTLIKCSDDEAQLKCEEIVHLLDFNHGRAIQFKEMCLNFYQNLLTFPQLSFEDQSIIDSRIKLLSDQKRKMTTRDKRQRMELKPDEFMLDALIILRKQHPLFCLHRYLTQNTGLKKSWQTFHSKGIVCIEDLFEKKILEKPTDLLRLEGFLERVIDC